MVAVLGTGVALTPYYLGDTSALARARCHEGERLVPLLEAGLVARCTPTDLEAGYSSTSPTAHRRMRADRADWPVAPMGQDILDRAVEVQDVLVACSRQRGVKIAHRRDHRPAHRMDPRAGRGSLTPSRLA